MKGVLLEITEERMTREAQNINQINKEVGCRKLYEKVHSNDYKKEKGSYGC